MHGRATARMQYMLHMICAIVLLCRGNLSAADATNASGHVIVSFPSDNKMLGYWYRPEGKPPFPAVIFHHGDHLNGVMKLDVAKWAEMAKLFTSRGYIFFLPDRHVDTFDKSEYSPGLQRQMQSKSTNSVVRNQQTIEKLDIVHKDVDAALRWVKQQPEVDATRIAIAGHLSGAVQTLYCAENSDVRALIAFSPGFTFWKTDPVLRGLLTTWVRKSKPPIFLIYAENNPTLEPAEALGLELEIKGKPNRTRIYPPFAQNGKAIIPLGSAVWGTDVLDFLQTTMQ